ncbi:MAG: MarR family transcriptional regulator [Clostridiales bacterium]|jgi:DNA-binding MarR family transcriptional regulator|nr:MarR family transcriptional regulator [Eubacteriales bacterium]MDH7567515.1 MarR family transcriptional regulator [Clostridiales bacterium]
MSDNRDDSLYAVFSQVIRLHHQRVHMVLQKLGVYPGQPPLLFTLLKQDGQSQNHLAQKLSIKAATITVMLSRMERVGLIERRSDPNDQRISRVYLTDKGKKLCEDVRDALMTVDRECFSNFTLEEQLLLRRFFLQMQDNLVKVCCKNAE